MKNMTLALAVAFSMIAMSNPASAKEEHVITLSNGQEVTLSLDYCIDPVTGRAHPCYFELKDQQQAADDSGACWDPVRKSYQPCL